MLTLQDLHGAKMLRDLRFFVSRIQNELASEAPGDLPKKEKRQPSCRALQIPQNYPLLILSEAQQRSSAIL